MTWNSLWRHASRWGAYCDGSGCVAASLRLLAAGVRVGVCDTDIARREVATQDGAIPYSSPKDLADNCRVILAFLPNPAASEDVITAMGGVSDSRAKGVTVIDLSTNSPKRAIGLARICRANGNRFLEAPMSGGVWAARDGSLSIMVGGKNGDVEAVLPVLRLIATSVIHMGPVGSGCATKLIHNMVGEIQVQAIAEAFCLGARMGIDIQMLYKALSKGMASSRVLTDLYRSGAVFGNRDVHVSLDSATKDQELLAEMAGDIDFNLTFTPSILATMRDLQGRGLGTQDVTETLSAFEHRHQVVARSSEIIGDTDMPIYGPDL